MTPTALSSSALPTTSARTVAGVTHIDLNYAAAMAKGSGSIFITDGAVQTVIDRATGQPKLRVVGGTFSKEITLDQVSISGTKVSFDATGLPQGAKLNVYMGAGTLTSGGKAVPAITVPDKLSFTTDVMTGLTATIAVEDRTLKAGADIKVTVTFSKALTTLDDAAISADHASIKGVTHSTDGRTWTITLGAADSIESATNALRLDMSKLTSADGTHGSGVLASSNYLVDTVVDAYLFDILGVNDEGPSDLDGITFVTGASGDNTQYVSGILLGSLASDEHIELSINGVAANKDHIHLVGEGDGWGWYYQPRDDGAPALVFNEGENQIVARVVKADGHTSATVTKTVIVDTVRPMVDSSPDGITDFALDADIVLTFDQPVYWEYEESDADILYLVGDNDTVIEVYLDDTNFSEGRQKLTISAAEHNLQPGVKYSLVLPENLTDLAGNPVFGDEIGFTTAGERSAPDTTGPSATRVFVEGDGHYKAGDVITFRLRFDEHVKIVEAIPAIGLSNGKKASYAGISGGDLLFKYTVGAGDDTADLEIADIAELGGTVHDDANNMLDMLASAHIVHGGIFDDSGYGSMIEVKVDTIAPTAPAAPALDAVTSDSGTLGDGITSDNSPALGGTAEANAHITIYDGGVEIGSTTANSDGVWNTVIGLSTALSDGAHAITVLQTDRAGNASLVSSALTLVIDTARPDAPAAPTLAAGSDSGTPGDSITSDDTPTLSGNAQANAKIEIYEGDTLLGTGSANGTGAWDATVDAAHALAEGTHNLTVQQVDLAGNRSPVSGVLALTVDRTAAALSAVTLAASSDTGSFDNDRITADTTPTFSGNGAEAGAAIVLYAASRVIGATYADNTGHWELTVLEADKFTVDGSYAITAKQTDKAGNTSAASPALTVQIDTIGPTVSSFLNNSSAREAQLGFDEQIVFNPTGTFRLFDYATNLLSLSFTGNSTSNWYVTDGAGGHDSVLNFKVSVSGLYNLHMNNESVQDLAGNVAIIGSPQWLVELPPPA